MKALLMQTPSLYGPFLRTKMLHIILGGFQFPLDQFSINSVHFSGLLMVN